MARCDKLRVCNSTPPQFRPIAARKDGPGHPALLYLLSILRQTTNVFLHPDGYARRVRKVRGAGCFMSEITAATGERPQPFRIDGKPPESARDVAAYFGARLGRIL